jgi:molybdopterin/thiamine biosynthesis adenylyltransferase
MPNKEVESKPEFNYERAFSRNIGWTTVEEQEILRHKTVAIAGMGGVGGHHAVNLARLGVANFHLADFDDFEVHNMNRQSGCDMLTLGQEKLSVMTARVLAINPEAKILPFPKGITPENLNSFLDGVDVYVDGLDAFVLDVRRSVFQRCHERGIPAVTVGPIGMGAALMNFMPGHMSFEEYFGFNASQSEIQKLFRFICGLTPSFIHLKSLVIRHRFDLSNKAAPSTSMGCYLAAGVAGTEVLKILLHRGPVIAAPHGLHFDSYTYRLRKPGCHLEA